MKSARTLTLFNNNPSSKTGTAQQLPLLSDKDRQALFAGKTVNYRTSYLYDPSRPQRHYEAQLFLQALYNTGAVLINTNQAYSSVNDLKLIDNEMLRDIAGDKPASVNEVQLGDSLMDKYRSLPECTIWNGGTPAVNPLHALFVLKIALDHLPPRQIFIWYKQLKQQAWNMTYGLSSVSFPNGSQFLGDHAAWQILRCYIKSNKARFSYISHDEQSSLKDDSTGSDSSYFDITGNKRDQDIKPLVFQLMKQDLSLLVKKNEALVTNESEEHGAVCRLM